MVDRSVAVKDIIMIYLDAIWPRKLLVDNSGKAKLQI